MAAHSECSTDFVGASLTASWAAPRLTRIAETAKKTGLASGLVGLGAGLHMAWHALPLAQVFFGSAALACHL